MKKRSFIFRRRNIRRQVRKRRYRYLIRGGIILTLLIGLIIGVRTTLARLELFSLNQIEIQGEVKSLTREQIIDLAGVKKGTNLFRIPLDQIRRNLKGQEFFKAIHVHRRLPSTLVIRIQEYSPELLLHTGRMYYVSGDGSIFRDITETRDPRDFPVITGISEEQLLQFPLKVKKSLKSAVELKSAYQETPLFQEYGLSEIHYEKNIGFTLYPEKKKYSIKVGAGDFDKKMKKLAEVHQKLQESRAKISSIDLNYPGKVLMTL